MFKPEPLDTSDASHKPRIPGDPPTGAGLESDALDRGEDSEHRSWQHEGTAEVLEGMQVLRLPGIVTRQRATFLVEVLEGLQVSRL